jgi:hypothetical protein
VAKAMHAGSQLSSGLQGTSRGLAQKWNTCYCMEGVGTGELPTLGG